MPRNVRGVTPSAITVRSTNGWLWVLLPRARESRVADGQVSASGRSAPLPRRDRMAETDAGPWWLVSGFGHQPAPSMLV